VKYRRLVHFAERSRRRELRTRHLPRRLMPPLASVVMTQVILSQVTPPCSTLVHPYPANSIRTLTPSEILEPYFSPSLTTSMSPRMRRHVKYN
jgi:hypothetical protein